MCGGGGGEDRVQTKCSGTAYTYKCIKQFFCFDSTSCLWFC